MTRREEREAVFKTIFQLPFFGGEDIPEIDEDIDLGMDIRIDEEGNSPDLTEENKAYINAEVQGIRDNIESIDEKIESNSNGWKVSRIGKAELAILRVAVYEILFDKDIPDKVAANEAVELAKKYTGDKSPAFINGILSGVMKSL